LKVLDRVKDYAGCETDFDKPVVRIDYITSRQQAAQLLQKHCCGISGKITDVPL
jgi:hypothetical protein